ncbi:MAG: glycosyltransferase [Bacteroidota bacterium]|nr:glycosyltransferase [Bacteroidota bacterium]
MKEAGYVLFGIYVLSMIWLFVNGLVQLHLWHLSKKARRNSKAPWKGSLPFISIQVPVYNEKYVVEGLLDCLANLAYPKEKLEVLVLDDSTDETVYLIDRKVAALQAAGFPVRTIRRTIRKGYKAGALQESLIECHGELIAIFDADFRPSPGYLLDMLPSFQDTSIGLVQARWGHLNQRQNFLTRIQSYLLDTYFTIEQAGRFNGGYYTNFCGTAGIWRKACIEDAGGWDGSVLSEDLDLSYRAQLKGWKIVYENEVVVPAELPSTLEAFKVQQARWTKGIMQVCRKNGKNVAAVPKKFMQNVHAFFHLTSSFIFPCLFTSSLLTLPLLLLRQYDATFILLTDAAAVCSLNLLFFTIVFYQGRKNSGDKQFWKYYPLFLVVYMALSVQNTIAVLQGLFGKSSAFIRTPKYAENKASSTTYSLNRQNSTLLIELLLFVYFLTGVAVSLYLDDYFYMILFLMMLSGLGILLYQSINLRRLRWPFATPKLSWR